MRKLIVANWKENPRSEAAARKLFAATAAGRPKVPGVDVVLCPPFIYLEELAAAFRKMSPAAKKSLTLGAQDVFWQEKGAFTSEIGPKMLRALGVRYAIIGHSERRKYLGETDAMVNRKIKLALQDGLAAIVCVGESLAVRKKGIAAARAFVKNQLKRDLAGVAGRGRGAAGTSRNVIVAYEPIWAIGTGKNDSPADAREMAAFIASLTANLIGTPARF